MLKSITIGIPVFNEEKYINNLLNYLNESKFNFQLKEILVVCSGCTDNSENTVKNWIKKNKKITILREKTRKGKFSAINKILRYSTGDYIIFIDADTLPRKNSLNYLVKPLDDSNVGAVSSMPSMARSKNTIIGYFQNFIWDSHDAISYSFGKMTGELCAIRRGIVKKIPNKIINDDAYLLAQISKTHKIVYQPEARTLIMGESNFIDYLKKRRRISQGFRQLSKMGFQVSVPSSLILKVVIKKILKEPSKFFLILLILLIEIYCNILAFIDIRRGRLDYKWDKSCQS